MTTRDPLIRYISYRLKLKYTTIYNKSDIDIIKRYIRFAKYNKKRPRS